MSAPSFAPVLGKPGLPRVLASFLLLAAAGTLSACSGAGPDKASDVADAGDGSAANGGDDAAPPDGTAADGSAGSSDASQDGGPSGDDAAAEASTPDAGPDGAPDAADAHVASGPIDITGGASCSGVLDVTAALTSGVEYHITAAGVAAGHDPGWGCNAAVPDGSKTYLSFNAPHAGNYVIRVTGGDESQWHDSAMYARRTCAQIDANTELACNPQAGFDSTLVGVDSPQTVYLVADGAYFLGDPIAGTSGFDLTIADYTACTSATDCSNFDGQLDCDVAGGDCFRPRVCPTGEASCDATQPNACNFNITDDVNDCGACGTACTTPSQGSVACVSSACVATCNTPGDVACSNACVDLQTDSSNCGACGTTCYSPANGSNVCVSSACVTTCDAGYLLCGSACDDTSTDPSNCGGCGTSCNGGGCNAGKCTAPLTPSFSFNQGTSSAADADALYVMETTLPALEQVITRYAFADGTATLVADLGPYNEYSAASIVSGPLAINSTTLFYFSGMDTFAVKLWSVPKTGGTPTQIAQVPSAGLLVVNDTDAFCSGLHIPLNGAAATTFTSDVWFAVGLDATYVYWIGEPPSGMSGSGLYRMARTATVDAPEEIAEGPFSASGPLLTVTPKGALVEMETGVYLQPLDGSAAVLLRANEWSSGGLGPGAPVASATNAYFFLGPALWQAALTGGSAVELATTYEYPMLAYVPSRGLVLVAPLAATEVYVLAVP